MKKIFVAILFLLASSLLAKAQIAPGRSPGSVLPPEVLAQNTQYVDLLSYQNHLLKNRKTALIVSLAGAGVGVIGSMVTVASIDASGGTYTIDSPVGSALMGIGSIAVTTGGIWLLINEFKLIDSQKRINEHLILRYGPDGVRLQF